MRLEALPNDVLAHLAEKFLTRTDLDNLICAFSGVKPDLWNAADVRFLVPSELRAKWLHDAMLTEAHSFLRRQDQVDRCLFHARNAVSVCAFADWSPFSSSGTVPLPLAEYGWLREEGGGPRAHLHVHEDAVARCVAEHLRRWMPVVYVAFYRVTRSWDASRIEPSPLFVGECRLYPATLLPL